MEPEGSAGALQCQRGPELLQNWHFSAAWHHRVSTWAFGMFPKRALLHPSDKYFQQVTQAAGFSLPELFPVLQHRHFWFCNSSLPLLSHIILGLSPLRGRAGSRRWGLPSSVADGRAQPVFYGLVPPWVFPQAQTCTDQTFSSVVSSHYLHMYKNCECDLSRHQ